MALSVFGPAMDLTGSRQILLRGDLYLLIDEEDERIRVGLYDNWAGEQLRGHLEGFSTLDAAAAYVRVIVRVLGP